MEPCATLSRSCKSSPTQCASRKPAGVGSGKYSPAKSPISSCVWRLVIAGRLQGRKDELNLLNAPHRSGHPSRSGGDIPGTKIVFPGFQREGTGFQRESTLSFSLSCLYILIRNMVRPMLLLLSSYSILSPSAGQVWREHIAYPFPTARQFRNFPLSWNEHSTEGTNFRGREPSREGTRFSTPPIRGGRPSPDRAVSGPKSSSLGFFLPESQKISG